MDGVVVKTEPKEVKDEQGSPNNKHMTPEHLRDYVLYDPSIVKIEVSDDESVECLSPTKTTCKVKQKLPKMQTQAATPDKSLQVSNRHNRPTNFNRRGLLPSLIHQVPQWQQVPVQRNFSSHNLTGSQHNYCFGPDNFSSQNFFNGQNNFRGQENFSRPVYFSGANNYGPPVNFGSPVVRRPENWNSAKYLRHQSYKRPPYNPICNNPRLKSKVSNVPAMKAITHKESETKMLEPNVNAAMEPLEEKPTASEGDQIEHKDSDKNKESRDPTGDQQPQNNKIVTIADVEHNCDSKNDVVNGEKHPEVGETQPEVQRKPKEEEGEEMVEEDVIIDVKEGQDLSELTDKNIPKYSAVRGVGASFVSELRTFKCRLCKKYMDTAEKRELHLRSGRHHMLFAKRLKSMLGHEKGEGREHETVAKRRRLERKDSATERGIEEQPAENQSCTDDGVEDLLNDLNELIDNISVPQTDIPPSPVV